MCLLIFAHQLSTRYPLLLAANRDEFHARPTQASRFWDSRPDLLAGRDLEQGGTWMGITRAGRFAAVTNYRDPSRTEPAPRSRGELCVNFLDGSESAAAFLQRLAPSAREYAGFNLLLGDGRDLWYYSNSGAQREWPQEPLAPGIYGLSNAQLDTPWPKSELGKARLKALLDHGEPTHEALSAVVADRSRATAPALARAGLDGEMDELLSAQFIVTPGYGTRCCTTLWTTASGVDWCERSYDAAGLEFDRQDVSFTLQDAPPDDD